MPTIEITTEIDAPRERVFDLARDVEAHVRSLPGAHEEVVAAPRQLLELGDEVTFRGRHFGRWWTHTSRITDLRRPESFRDEMVAGFFARFRHDHGFAERNGATTMIDRVELASGYPFADRLVARYVRRRLTERARVLKELAE